MQDAGARRVGNAEGMRGIVRKHDCALPAQYTKHNITTRGGTHSGTTGCSVKPCWASQCLIINPA